MLSHDKEETLKVAIPMSKRDLVLECCKSALHQDLTEYQESVVEGIQKVFKIKPHMAFPTAVVYVVDSGEFDLMLRLSHKSYSTVGDMLVIDEGDVNAVLVP